MDIKDVSVLDVASGLWTTRACLHSRSLIVEAGHTIAGVGDGVFLVRISPPEKRARLKKLNSGKQEYWNQDK